METTVRNMYKVIYDKKCGAIIMLSNLAENSKVGEVLLILTTWKTDIKSWLQWMDFVSGLSKFMLFQDSCLIFIPRNAVFDIGLSL